MRPLLPLLVLGSLLALGACETEEAAPPPLHHRAPEHRPPPPDAATHYDEQDFAWAAEHGDNTIAGHVALRTKALGPFTCAGGSVALTPETPYSAARTMRLYDSDQHAVASVESVRVRSAGDGAPPYAAFVKSTSCDADGRFAFHDLPDGAWFLIARAKPVRGDGAALVIMQRVEARGGRTVGLELR
jgi:hypothetical protein